MPVFGPDRLPTVVLTCIDNPTHGTTMKAGMDHADRAKVASPQLPAAALQTTTQKTCVFVTTLVLAGLITFALVNVHYSGTAAPKAKPATTQSYGGVMEVIVQEDGSLLFRPREGRGARSIRVDVEFDSCSSVLVIRWLKYSHREPKAPTCHVYITSVDAKVSVVEDGIWALDLHLPGGGAEETTRVFMSWSAERSVPLPTSVGVLAT